MHTACLTGLEVPLPRQFLFMVRGEPDVYCVSDRSGCSLGDSGDFTFGSFAMPGLTLFVLLKQKDEYLTDLAVPSEAVEALSFLFSSSSFAMPVSQSSGAV